MTGSPPPSLAMQPHEVSPASPSGESGYAVSDYEAEAERGEQRRDQQVHSSTREEGWYPILIGGRLACLYWTGRHWEIPLGVRCQQKGPEMMTVGPRIQWPEK
jgi:hypothetical protein